MTYTQYAIPANYMAALGDRFMQRNGKPGKHRGTDFAPGGVPQPAFAAGIVVKSEYSIGMGHVVEVQHADGKVTGYGHLAARYVNVGQGVALGQSLGLLGNTGIYSMGRHSHVTLGDKVGAIYSGTVYDILPYAAARVRPAAVATSSTWEWWVPSGAQQKRIQRALKARRRYFGPVDGAWGRETIKGIQRTIQNVGYPGRVDGEPGPLTCEYVQRYAQKFGRYAGPIDKKLGPNTWAGFALGLELP